MTGQHAEPDDGILVIGTDENDGARFAYERFGIDGCADVCVIWPANPAPMLGHQFREVYFTPASVLARPLLVTENRVRQDAEGGLGLTYAVGPEIVFTPDQIAPDVHHPTGLTQQDRMR